jgi:hypothetical protein
VRERLEAPPDPGEPDQQGARRSTAQTSRRRFLGGSVAGIAASGVLFAWLVTGGTWQFLQSVPFSNFYDVQARSLLSGTWSMPASVLSIEGIRTDGRTDMYYGPVPALLRLPVLLFTHRLDGRLTPISLLVAFVVALTFVTLISWRVRGMVRGQAPVTRLEAVLTAAFIVVVGVGSVLFFLGSTAQVYEEAELWGAALTLGAFYSLAGFIEHPSTGRLLGAAIFTTLALLTRGSVGAGPVLALGLLATIYVLAWASDHVERWRPVSRRLARLTGIQVSAEPGRLASGLVVATIVPVFLYAAVNYVKFGTAFSLPLNRQVATTDFAHRRAVLAANGGSLFGLKFVPTNLLQYVRPDALSISRFFPWIFFPGKALVVGNVLYTTRDWTSSVPASMPLLTILAVIGAVCVYRPANRPAPEFAPPPRIASLRLLLVAATACTAGILAIAFLAERYLADVMPLLLLAAVAGWHVVQGCATTDRSRRRRRRRWRPAWRSLLTALCVLLALFEVWTTISLSLFYQRELGPAVTIPQRAGMVSLQQQVRRWIASGPTPDVRFVASLPRRASALDLAVVGRCAAVYQYDGNSWHPVEIGARGGGFLLEVTFPQTDRGQRQPLLVSGESRPQDVLAVTWEGGDRYRFSYRFNASLSGKPPPPWYAGPVFRVAVGQPHRVQVDLLAGLGQIFATVDGSPAFSLLYPVAFPGHVRFGTAPASVSTTPAFAGYVRPLPVPTPICDQLVSRRELSASTTNW